MTDVLVVGAGFYGLTVAERLAEMRGLNVTVIDKRDHIGGNSHSYIDSDTGIEVHSYGSHIFHTSNERVIEYVQKFTSFNGYRHTVYSNHNGQVYSMPFNLATINQFFQSAMGPEEARSFIADLAAEVTGDPESSLDAKCVSMVGRPLYEAFVRSYTAKQWQTDPSELPASVIARLPVRYNYDNSYFSDTFQGIPAEGYFAWHERMADHSRIQVKLGVDYFDESQEHSRGRTVGNVPVIYTGALDRYFDYVEGELSWRTIDFETERLDIEDYQGTSVVNYPDPEIPYTRIHEFQHYHPEQKFDRGTVIMREYSRFAGAGDDPYYPINSTSDRERLNAYRELAKLETGVHFGGRLGTYQYLDMHMAIASALVASDTEIVDLLRKF